MTARKECVVDWKLFREPSYLFLQRELDAENGAGAFGALDGDTSVISGTNRFNDSQTEAGASELPRSCFVQSKEPVEDLRRCVFWNADSRVSHLENNPAIFAAGCHGHRSARRGVLDGII